jgi:hypothetical protein
MLNKKNKKIVDEILFNLCDDYVKFDVFNHIKTHKGRHVNVYNNAFCIKNIFRNLTEKKIGFLQKKCLC